MVNNPQEDVTELLAPMLRKTLYVALIKALATSDEMLPFGAGHLRYMNELEACGVLLASGPFVQGGVIVGDGLTILNTSDAAKAPRLMEEEPLVKRGMRSFELRKWELRKGRISIKLHLSRSAFDLN